MHTFHRCQMHSKLPDLQAWMLELRPGDWETFEKLHTSVATNLFRKSMRDPHIKKIGGKPVNRMTSELEDPISWAAKWMATAGKLFAVHDRIFVNVVGGMAVDLKILATKRSKKIVFPKHWPDEVITISRYPRAAHWYLSSNKDRIFVPAKVNTVRMAREMAETFVPSDRVIVK